MGRSGRKTLLNSILDVCLHKFSDFQWCFKEVKYKMMPDLRVCSMLTLILLMNDDNVTSWRWRQQGTSEMWQYSQLLCCDITQNHCQHQGTSLFSIFLCTFPVLTWMSERLLQRFSRTYTSYFYGYYKQARITKFYRLPKCAFVVFFAQRHNCFEYLVALLRVIQLFWLSFK
jgi:hypothetical protein